MLDLSSLREQRQKYAQRYPIKTFLTERARARLEAAAEVVGCPMTDILEELCMTYLPAPEVEPEQVPMSRRRSINAPRPNPKPKPAPKPKPRIKPRPPASPPRRVGRPPLPRP